MHLHSQPTVHDNYCQALAPNPKPQTPKPRGLGLTQKSYGPPPYSRLCHYIAGCAIHPIAGRGRGENDSIQATPHTPPSKRVKIQAKRTQSHTKFIPKERLELANVGPRSKGTVQLARQNSVELDHSEHNACTYCCPNPIA